MPDPKPYPNNKYLLCKDGTWIPETCPLGSYYYYYETDYCLNSTCYEGDQQQAPLDDTKYLECACGLWVEKSCPPGDKFNRYLSQCQNTTCKNGTMEDTYTFWDAMYVNCGVLTLCPNQDKFWPSVGRCYGSNETALVTNTTCGGITSPSYSDYLETYMDCQQGNWVLEYCPNNGIFLQTTIGTFCMSQDICAFGANKTLTTPPAGATSINPNGTYYYHCYGYWLVEACPPGQVFDSGLMRCTLTPNGTIVYV